ncbi:acyltransferase [Streptomyces anulatus]|uniref:acyltransferase n=1 Tax=Streptomyces anulatus TaxID=1892 RepID=UPI001C26495A|nr:acyltransferase [Streptomyces anulatus]
MVETNGFPGVELRVRAGGARIGVGVRIGEGTVIVADQLVLGDGAVIGAGCDLRSARLELGAGSRVGDGARWLVADAVGLGAGSVVDAGSEVVCRRWSVGEGCYIGHRLRVGAGASMEERSTLRIGDRCQIAPDVVVNPTEPVVIGDEVGISAQVAIWTHGYHAGHPVRDGHGAAFAGVEVQDGVWLGVRAVVLPGVRVGAGTVVAAMGLVNRSLPAGVLAAGVPARVKHALEPRVLDVAGRRAAVAVLVEDWMARLRFKGLDVHPAGPGEGGGWSVVRAGERWEVALRAGGDQHPGVVEVRREGAGPCAVFDFAEPLAVRGVLDELGHDLRDFLRRATWLFPYTGNSRGLVPGRFARLLG